MSFHVHRSVGRGSVVHYSNRNYPIPAPADPLGEWRIWPKISCPRLTWDTHYTFELYIHGSWPIEGIAGRSFITPPEPETPTPPPSEPEPETPDPEPEACPVERCDHLAIVPAMPRALSGDEGSPDHWLHVVNPGAVSIRFTIEGRDMAGTKAGTHRRELPAS